MARSDKNLELLPDYEKAKKAPSKAKVIQLLMEGHQLYRMAMDAGDRLKEIKSELAQIQFINDLPGLRHGTLCFIASERSGRSALSKEKLIDNGVDPALIEECTVRGQPYLQTELMVMGAADRQKGKQG